MKFRIREIDGMPFLPHQEVAELFQVEGAWLLEVHSFGLLEVCVENEEGLCIGLVELDRVARIIWLHGRMGLDLAEVVLELAE